MESLDRSEHIAKWWGPNGFRNTTYEMDVRPGGRWRFTMHGPDGTDYENLVVYREIVAPERLAYFHTDAEDTGAHRFEATATFVDVGGKTLVTLTAQFPTAEARENDMEFGAVEGGHQTLARLDHYLKGEFHAVR